MREDEDYYRRCVQFIIKDRRQILDEYFESTDAEEDFGLPYIVSYKAGRRDATDKMWRTFAIIFAVIALGTVFAIALSPAP